MTKTASSHALPRLVPPLLVALFGLASVVFIRGFDAPGVTRFDLALISLSLAALVTSLVWFFVLALRRGPWWPLAMLVPYVNFLAASSFARRYWSEGARAPALLAIAAVLGQTLATVRLLLPSGPLLV